MFACVRVGFRVSVCFSVCRCVFLGLFVFAFVCKRFGVYACLSVFKRVLTGFVVHFSVLACFCGLLLFSCVCVSVRMFACLWGFVWF